MSTKTEKTAAVPTGIKVSELAKDLSKGLPKSAEIKSTDVLNKAKELGIPVKGHSSVLTPGQADRLRAKLGATKKLKESVDDAKARSGRRPAITPEELAADDARQTESTDAGASGHSEALDASSFAAPADEEPMPAPSAHVVEAVAEPEVEAPQEQQAEVQEETAQAEDAPAVETVEAAATEDAGTETQQAPAKPTRFGVVTPAPEKPAGEVVAEPEAPAAPASKSGYASAVSPALTQPPKKLLGQKEIAPPIRREVKADASRFGVVKAAPVPTPEEIKAKAAAAAAPQSRSGGRPANSSVESKPINEFKPQVNYPSMPSVGRGEDDRGRTSGYGGGGAGGAGMRGRSGPMRSGPGVKGFSGGPRRGMGLMNQDERYRGARRPKQRGFVQKPTVVRVGPADVTSPVSIKSLCESLGIKATDLIRKFFEQGKMVTINSILSDEDAMLYAIEFDPLKHGIVIKKARDVEEELLKKAELPDSEEDLIPRAPVVTIMGHVDHGKTSLLDYIRNAKVAAGEAGGITQHIGAYKVKHAKGEIAFIDTPGHKAFTEMRARGANVTDIVILVVSAVDGVMPQTEEALSHARSAKKKIVVALNKIDMPEANADKVRGQLAAKELFVEGYGGEVGCVEVSAKTGQGIDELLDRLLLEAEILELTANPDKHAVGTVVEAHKDQGRGIVATVLVQEGTLAHGDVIICGHAYGSVRQIYTDTGKTLDEAGPSTPVLITGLNEVPLSGERFHVMESIKDAAEIADMRAMRMRQEGLIQRQHVTLETLSDLLKQGAVASLNLVLKVDVQGSLAPLRNAVGELSQTDARINIIHDGVGAINETDVILADASDAIVIGFSVAADPGARRVAEERGVDIRTYTIIYEIVDVVKKALEGMLKPIEKEVIQGHAQVRQIFKISKVGNAAGCIVTDGTIFRNSNVRLLRDSKVVWSGKLISLKRLKDDAKEVRQGFECGLRLDGFDDIKPDDVVEFYTTELEKRLLD